VTLEDPEKVASNYVGTTAIAAEFTAETLGEQSIDTSGVRLVESMSYAIFQPTVMIGDAFDG
jgi:hypothetical protein